MHQRRNLKPTWFKANLHVLKCWTPTTQRVGGVVERMEGQSWAAREKRKRGRGGGWGMGMAEVGDAQAWPPRLQPWCEGSSHDQTAMLWRSRTHGHRRGMSRVPSGMQKSERCKPQTHPLVRVPWRLSGPAPRATCHESRQALSPSSAVTPSILL